LHPNYCPFCKDNSSKFWFLKKIKADSGHTPYEIYRCKSCSSAYVYPLPTEEFLNIFYNELQPLASITPGNRIEDTIELIYSSEKSYPNTTLDARRIIEKCKKYSSGSRFLDVGAGFGLFTREAIKLGFECTAIEASRNNCDIFEAINGFKPNNQLLDFEFANSHQEKFDVVLLSQVLEHIPEPEHAVKLIQKILKKDGVCAVAVPHFGSFVSKFQGTKDMFITPPEHLNFFSIQGLNKLFIRNNFTVISTQTISRYDLNKLTTSIKSKLIALCAFNTLLFFFFISDILNKGMFINSFFRKK
jgi:SAM-dependent methyltransferase